MFLKAGTCAEMPELILTGHTRASAKSKEHEAAHHAHRPAANNRSPLSFTERIKMERQPRDHENGLKLTSPQGRAYGFVTELLAVILAMAALAELTS
jgi:hypothetical protein